MFLFAKNNTFIEQATVKTFISLQIISISNKSPSFELSIHQRILNNKRYHSFHKKYLPTQLLSTLMIIRNIRQISEGSCDTEEQ